MINEKCAKSYCKDAISKIENYDKAIADNTQTWECHHRLELTLDGEFAHTPEELKRLGMYYDRPYFELIFLTKLEHSRLHKEGANHPLYRRHHSEETRQKISASLKDINREPRSEFGNKFKEHYDMTSIDNSKLYQKEYRYYRHNGKCSWE